MTAADGLRIGVVAVITVAGKFLVIRRSKHVEAPLTYCFPGGAHEPGETEEQAVTRECHEELGISAVPRRRLWTSVTPWKVRLAWWLAEIPEDVQVSPNPDEVESVHWLTANQLGELEGLLESNRQFLQAWMDGEVDLDLPLR